MSKALPRRFFDSNTIVRLVENHSSCAPVMQALLDEAKAGHWRVVVSALIKVEVTREKGKAVDPTKMAKLMGFFDNSYIFVRDLDSELANDAVKLVYDYTWLHPADAIHLAAAIDTRCEVFYTYDNKLISKFDGENGLSVKQPEMPVITMVPTASTPTLFDITDYLKESQLP